MTVPGGSFFSTFPSCCLDTRRQHANISSRRLRRADSGSTRNVPSTELQRPLDECLLLPDPPTTASSASLSDHSQVQNPSKNAEVLAVEQMFPGSADPKRGAVQALPRPVTRRFRVQGSGFRVQGLGFRVQGSGFKVQGSGDSAPAASFQKTPSPPPRAGTGAWFRVQGFGFRVWVWGLNKA